MSEDMVTPQDLMEEAHERAGMTIPQLFPCSDLPIKSVPSPLEDIRHHPDDAMDALALVAGMEPWRYHLAETEEVPKGDPEIFVIDHMPGAAAGYGEPKTLRYELRGKRE